MRKWIGLVLSGAVFANPLQPTVVSGDAFFQEMGSLLEIKTGDRAVINWNEFSISPSEITQFVQPNDQSVVLNQVIGTACSLIEGTLKANGQVLLINQNGVLVGKDAIVDTGSFVASSLDQIGNLRFAGDSPASVVNEGTIFARNGDAVLISRHVENKGRIEAENALFGSGREVWIQPNPKERLFVRVGQGEKEGVGIENTGRIEAVRAELRADGNLYALALNQCGEIDALGVVERNGEIFLVADKGDCHIFGSLNAPQGEIQVNAEHTYIHSNAVLSADGNEAGDGGKIVAWGQKGIVMRGKASAKGGANSGNGGFVEISSPGGMEFSWNADVSAPNGKAGTLCLDPTTVNIFAGGTTPRTFMDVPPTSWAALTNPVDIDSIALGTYLNTMGNVTITTDVVPDPNPMNPGTISVTSPINWDSGNKLTLIASNSITILDSIAPSGMMGAYIDLDLQAPTVTIGNHATVMSPIDIGNDLSLISITAPSSINVLGGAAMNADATLRGDQINFSGGNFLLESGSPIDTDALIFATTSFNGQFTGNITWTGDGGGTGIGGQQSMMAPPCSVTLTGNNMTMIGGTGAGAMSHVGSLINIGGTGTVICNLTGDLFIQAGSAVNDGKTGMFVGGGSISLNANNITMLGGSTPSVEGNSVLFAIFGGDMIVNAAGQIFMQGGTDPGCGVVFVAGGHNQLTASSVLMIGGTATPAMDDASVVIGAGNQLTLNISGDLNMTSPLAMNTSGAFIGNFLGAITENITVGGDININAFGGRCFIGARDAGPHTINLQAANLNLSSFYDQPAFILVDDGTLNCNILGACAVHGGGIAPAMGINFTGFVGASTAGLVSNLNVTAGDAIFSGGLADSCYAGILLGDFSTGVGGGGGEIHLTATGTGIQLNGGGANNTPAVIEIIGSAASNAIFFDVTSSYGNVELRGSPIAGLTNAGARIATSSGPIIDPVGGSIILDGTMSGPAVISVGPGPAAELLLQAGANIELRSAFSSIENLSAGDMNLVVDANFPEPFMGLGRIITASGSSIFTTGGALRIFTSQQSYNQISGTLNGLNFAPGTIFVDTATEIWGVYYPSLLGGFSYTVFYKNILQLLTQQAATIASELASSLHPFNEFPGWVMRFTMKSDEYESPYFLRRRVMSHLNHPKSWSHLMPE